jgi:hypothetical protein
MVIGQGFERAQGQGLAGRARRRDQTYRKAAQTQREHRRRVHLLHPDGIPGEDNCSICERSVWYFSKRKSLGHHHHCWMCHPKYREGSTRARIKQYMARYGVEPRPRYVQ